MREKGQTEVAKTLGTPVFSRGIEILTEKWKLLWMIGEIGEVIDIIKKNGSENAVSDDTLREQLIEELADVLMYYNDVLLCYGITADELKQSYTSKFRRNMTRW